LYFVRHALQLYVIIALVAAVVFAVSPLGKVTSSEPFQLRGAQVPVAGVPSWPLMNGDEIGAVTAPATIQMRDGSRVVLAKGSRAKVEEKDGKTLLRLVAGTGEYSLTAKSDTLLYVKDKPAAIPSGSKGVISLDGRAVSSAVGAQVKPALLPPPPPVLSSK
jgi:hypothetical protein